MEEEGQDGAGLEDTDVELFLEGKVGYDRDELDYAAEPLCDDLGHEAVDEVVAGRL